MNQNTGKKKPLIHIEEVAQDQEKKENDVTARMAEQALKSAEGLNCDEINPRLPRRKRDPKEAKTIMKGIYFDPIVFNELMVLQKRGQNISKLINRLTRDYLGLSR